MQYDGYGARVLWTDPIKWSYQERNARGLPKCILQEEKKKRSAVLAVRGTVKRQLSYAMILNSQILWLQVSMTPASLSTSFLHVVRVSSG